ncbi:MAG: hypothetical protein ACJ8C4_05760 [Gemmataceae bacterium]
MAGEAVMSVGTTLEYQSAPSTYVGLTQVVDCGSPEVSRPTKMVSGLSEVVTHKKKGRFDAGQATITLKHYGTVYKKFRDWCRGETSVIFRMTTIDAATEVFESHVVKVGRPIPADDHIVFTVTLDVTGDPTVTDPT